ncbi:hypothetical protein DFH94DRAFT_764761 [Russula ochroleuca]|jgi:hypothetical protein|uniref:Uncharacterized protein n=1 Tax=Russula ochroleuca TaxID=152965 RepID=A0A9P5K004_9AGAM|nr:hypothetical protein DFH94DRAFT_764761 [Russula ochroleuca]
MNYTRPANVCLYPQPGLVHTQYSPGMSYLASSTSSLQSTGTIGQGAIRGKSQWQRYASFSYRLVNKHDPRTTVHILHRSTSSTMIHCLTSFISIDRPSLTGTRLMVTVSWGGGDGDVNDGGSNLPKFARDGETSFLSHHPTWIFASSVHMACPLQTCWQIHLPFLSSSITQAQIGTSLPKMKRE